jgi:hypothetical protein
MKYMVCGNVFGDFELLKHDSEFMEADAVLICGNVGIERGGGFEKFWNEELKIKAPVFCVTGKHEDFGYVKELKEIIEPVKSSMRMPFYFLDPTYVSLRHKDPNRDPWVSGVSGTYSEKFYLSDSAPARHMTRKQLYSIKKNLDIVLLHNVPGKLGKTNGVNFDLDFFTFLEEKEPRYVFVGGYGFNNYSFFPYLKTTVLFLSSLERGYAIIDTDGWSCYYNNKMGKVG